MLSWAEIVAIKAPTDVRELRKYGFTMGLVFAGVFGSAVPLVLTHRFVLWPWVLAAPFALLATLLPRALGPVYVWWMRLGAVLGAVSSRLVLAVLFFLLVTPIALVRRVILGHDTMGGTYDRRAASYRVRRVDSIGGSTPLDMNVPY